MSWPTAKLGEVADVKIGPFGSLLHKSDYVEGGVPLVNPMHIVDGRIIVDPEHAVSAEKADQLANYRLTEGDVVLGRRGEMGRCAVVRPEDHGYLCGTGSLIVRPGPSLNSRFVHLLLSSPDMVRTFERASLGTTMPNLNQEIVANLEIPLPPLDEQRRIAAILDHADALRTKRRQAVNQFEALYQSIFTGMFDNTEGRLPLSELSVEFTSGLNVLGTDHDSHPVNRVIKVSSISSGYFKADEVKPMPLNYSPPETHRLHKGDILFGRASGSIDLLGATAVMDQQIDDLFLPDKVWRLEVTDTSLAIPEYVHGVLCSAEFRAYVRHNASGAAGVRNIGKSTVLAYRAPAPPLSRQTTYAAVIRAMRAKDAIAVAHSNLLGQLFDSLQSRAFRGEL